LVDGQRLDSAADTRCLGTDHELNKPGVLGHEMSIVPVVLGIRHLICKEGLFLQKIPGHLEVSKVMWTLFAGRIKIWKSYGGRNVIDGNSLLVVLNILVRF